LILKRDKIHIKHNWHDQYMLVEINRLLGDFKIAAIELERLEVIDTTYEHRLIKQVFEKDLIKERNSKAKLLIDGVSY